MQKNYAEHHATVTVNAPVHQVYSLFTHFNDFPKFMHFVKEVTYHDDQSSHWVAEMVGKHEWDAVNENWVDNQQIGWRSTDGLQNFGKITFEPLGNDQTRINASINYIPPEGIVGQIGEKLGAGSRFEHSLQADLNNFAHMVDEAPTGALDPSASNYLFHGNSAAAKDETTTRQNQTMYDDSKATQTRTAQPQDKSSTSSTNQSKKSFSANDIDTGSVPVEPSHITPDEETHGTV